MLYKKLIVLASLAAVAASAASRTSGQDMTLVVNPRTGQTTLRNVGGASLNLDGYLIASAADALSPTGWTSLQDAGTTGWREANPSSRHISETNLLSSLSVAVDGSVNLGSAYTPFAPTAVGQAEPPVTFDFHVAGASTVSGSVLFAPANNLVLLVNPATGAAAIQNQSNFAVDIDGYTISSPSSALSRAGWTSFIDSGVAGWREANPAATHLSEVNLTGARSFAANSGAVAIGSPVDPTLLASESDLVFDYHIAGGATVRGYVAFELPAVGPPPGDFDANGRVDGSDFLAWQRGEAPGGLTATSLAAWRTSFGAGGASAPLAAATQAVPEPWGVAPAVIAAAAPFMRRRGRAPTST